MLGNERDDVVHLLLRWLEAAFAVGGDNELVSFHTVAIVVLPHIRRIAQAVVSVEVIACVFQHILNVDPCFEVIVCQMVIHYLHN